MKLKFRDNRVSAFFCLAGLVALVPSFFVPALLVSDAAEGSRWFSIWSGIQLLYEEGNIFLSGLIFVFSMIFPILKLGTVLVCCIGAHRFDPKVSQTLVKFSGYTAKYSLLDVVVIALIVVLVKVDGYVRMVPTLGIYLFAAAVVASVFAELTFSKRTENWSLDTAKRRFPARALLAAVVALGVTFFAGVRINGQWWSEPIGAVEVERLNNRFVPRSVERLKDLKDAYDENTGWLPSENLLGELANTFQALTTDVGQSVPELTLSVKTKGGEYVSGGVRSALLDTEAFQERWEFPEPVTRRDISGVRLQSRIQFIGRIGHTVTEQELTVEDDWYRGATSVWFGRLFQYTLVPIDEENSVRARILYGGIGALGLLVTLVAFARVLVRGEIKD
ncbi:MAG: paraquat-inducible protein A [Verrucomicrobiota bacterium]